jgi:protein-S-isoprenylcysteine O-methyltransferase Ste14
MTDKIVLVALTVLFIAAFVTRNLLVKTRTGQPVRTMSGWVVSAIGLTGLCFLTAILSLSDKWYRIFGEISVLRHSIITYAGLFLLGIGIVSCWIFSAQLKDSWRIGIPKGQKTELIEDGVYAHVRNPYFDAYYVMFLGLFLARPSVVLLVLTLSAVAVFHLMVLKEEIHLLNVHGGTYLEYKKEAGRYIPRMGGRSGKREKLWRREV